MGANDPTLNSRVFQQEAASTVPVEELEQLKTGVDVYSLTCGVSSFNNRASSLAVLA